MAGSPEQMKDEVRGVINTYLDAVRTWNADLFRSTFHPQANIMHYYVKGDAMRVSTLEEFVSSIGSLHDKFDNAEEQALEIDVLLADHIATARVPFRFIMGDRSMEGQDLFNLAKIDGEWRIIHKSYYL
jgi:hypothetical protein